ncbi:helix-turn-helix transcriptional regulator [Azoarcus sp. CIB]|uniref:helix-turn-helix domain-containing protein n=1 Tax=Aromatoleum sp. (strain CIB) TaxID=198107 RepID=UPI0009F96E0C|nr:helix-turn-helix transcriptional regulator [Azoarcus sp. CIB]
MQKSIYSRQYRTFLELLRSQREAVGLTQEDLATRLESTQSFVSKCERGERRLDLVELHSWCVAMGVPLSDFVARFEVAVADEGKALR